MTVALVTGGGGFLGQALCRALIARGATVRSLARGDYPELNAVGVETIRGDIACRDDVLRTAEGCDVVFHVAAKAGVWGAASEYHRANVVGTQNVLEACRHHGVARLIYTSSPSVVYAGHDEAGLNESTPYPATYLTHYPRTKAEAERLVLAANGPTLSTVALRPHLIWGPGDNHLVPRLIARAKAGKLRRVGNGRNRVDTTYIDNAVAAHLAAFDRLSPTAACAGKTYFIANNEPRPLWELIDQMLACADLPPVRQSISAGTAYSIGAVLEGLYTVMRWQDEPPMTRFVARQLSTDHWYDLTAAIHDLGYQPAVSVDEGLRRLREWMSAR
ncbi:MAG: NAD-dependent epimerase/dehydratase family protein [Planctomycetaceae bacterium]|nr:NAD-dependent epimerase/dehydratase family protein [Planctomycetaceae bacterium]